MAYMPAPAYGPWLRYQDWEPNTNAWKGSVLVVTSQAPPVVTITHTGHTFTPQPLCLDTFQGYNFWRYELNLQLMPTETRVEYVVGAVWTSAGGFSEKRRAFTLPGADQPWHWAFHSCNGFSHGTEASWLQAKTRLWKDVMEVHNSQPLHCMVGGGDQIYMDGFWEEPSLVEWFKIKDRAKRETTPFSQEMEAQVSHFAFHHYVNHFSSPDMSDAFASIPQCGQADDHDFMDGFGSYPEKLQHCPVFQGAYFQTRRFFLLFQQHTNLQMIHQFDLFGAGHSFSMMRLLGKHVAVIAPDVRSERTLKQVISPESWQIIFNRIQALPGTVRHLFMLTTLPVVWPEIPMTDKVMGLMSTLGRDSPLDLLLTKTGLWGSVHGKVISKFNEPELLDDLRDGWFNVHKKERDMLLKQLQAFAQSKQLRVTFISGDVHLAGVGRLYSHPKVDLRSDHRFMPQVVSSAIMNAPPPAGLISSLQTCSTAKNSVDRHTKEKMVRLFKKDLPKTDKLMGRRNWATIRELPEGVAPPTGLEVSPKDPPLRPGDLIVTLRVEWDHKQPSLPVRQYPVPIPTLERAGGIYGAPGAAPAAAPIPAPCGYEPHYGAAATLSTAWPQHQQGPPWDPTGTQAPAYGAPPPAQPSYGTQPDLSHQFSSMSVGTGSYPQHGSQPASQYSQGSGAYLPQPAGGSYGAPGNYDPAAGSYGAHQSGAGSYDPAAGSYGGHQSGTGYGQGPGGYTSTAGGYGQGGAATPAAGGYDQSGGNYNSARNSFDHTTGSYGQPGVTSQGNYSSHQPYQQPTAGGYPQDGSYNASSGASTPSVYPPPLDNPAQASGSWQQQMPSQAGQWDSSQQGGAPGGGTPGNTHHNYQQPSQYPPTSGQGWNQQSYPTI